MGVPRPSPSKCHHRTPNHPNTGRSRSQPKSCRVPSSCRRSPDRGQMSRRVHPEYRKAGVSKSSFVAELSVPAHSFTRRRCSGRHMHLAETGRFLLTASGHVSSTYIHSKSSSSSKMGSGTSSSAMLGEVGAVLWKRGSHGTSGSKRSFGGTRDGMKQARMLCRIAACVLATAPPNARTEYREVGVAPQPEVVVVVVVVEVL